MSHSAHTSKASSVFEGDDAEVVLGQDGGYAHSQRRGSVASIDSLISAAVEDIERQLAVIRRDHMIGTAANHPIDQWTTNRESARVPSQTEDDQRRRIDTVDVGTRRSTARRPANAAVERTLVDYPQRAVDRAVTSNNLSGRFSTQQRMQPGEVRCSRMPLVAEVPHHFSYSEPYDRMERGPTYKVRQHRQTGGGDGVPNDEVRASLGRPFPACSQSGREREGQWVSRSGAISI